MLLAVGLQQNTDAMGHTKKLHTCIAATLLVVMCSIIAAGLVTAKPAHGQGELSSSAQGEGCSLTAPKGTGSKNQPLESSHYDHNPSCCHHTETPLYSPEVTLLVVPELFTTVSPVYFDQFVPPQNVI